jgi:hypothetical protein
MKLYFDTSALVKFFHEERGSSEVTAWVEDPQNEIWLMAKAMGKTCSEVLCSKKDLSVVEKEFAGDWSGYLQVGMRIGDNERLIQLSQQRVFCIVSKGVQGTKLFCQLSVD